MTHKFENTRLIGNQCRKKIYNIMQYIAVLLEIKNDFKAATPQTRFKEVGDANLTLKMR